jgi:hypothetical protein
VGRRRFEHLVVELSVAVGQVIPRYALWLKLGELGWDPEALSRRAVMSFFDEHLQQFVNDCGASLTAREARRLRRTLERFNPAQLTPYEHMQRLGSSRG